MVIFIKVYYHYIAIISFHCPAILQDSDLEPMLQLVSPEQCSRLIRALSHTSNCVVANETQLEHARVDQVSIGHTPFGRVSVGHVSELQAAVKGWQELSPNHRRGLLANILLENGSYRAALKVEPKCTYKQCNSLTNTCAIIIEIIMCTQLIHRLVWRRKYLLFHCILLFLLLITRKCCDIGQAKEFCIVQIHRAGYVCVLCISHVHCLRKHITFGEYLDTYIYIIVTLITSME